MIILWAVLIYLAGAATAIFILALCRAGSELEDRMDG